MSLSMPSSCFIFPFQRTFANYSVFIVNFRAHELKRYAANEKLYLIFTGFSRKLMSMFVKWSVIIMAYSDDRGLTAEEAVRNCFVREELPLWQLGNRT